MRKDTDDLEAFRALHFGGCITHVGMDYGGTLTIGSDKLDPETGIRPVSAAAATAVRQLVEAGVTPALVSNTRPDQDHRRALNTAGLAEIFGDRVYLSHELGIDKAHPRYWNLVMEDLSTSPGELLVCGDNIDTDVYAPAALGIHSVLLGPITARTHLPPHAALINQISGLPGLLAGSRSPMPVGVRSRTAADLARNQGRTHDDP